MDPDVGAAVRPLLPADGQSEKARRALSDQLDQRPPGLHRHEPEAVQNQCVFICIYPVDNPVVPTATRAPG